MSKKDSTLTEFPAAGAKQHVTGLKNKFAAKGLLSHCEQWDKALGLYAD